MERIFNRNKSKDKNARSNSRLSFFRRKKDKADQQAHDNGDTSESSSLISKIGAFDMRLTRFE